MYGVFPQLNSFLCVFCLVFFCHDSILFLLLLMKLLWHWGKALLYFIDCRRIFKTSEIFHVIFIPKDEHEKKKLQIISKNAKTLLCYLHGRSMMPTGTNRNTCSSQSEYTEIARACIWCRDMLITHLRVSACQDWNTMKHHWPTLTV